MFCLAGTAVVQIGYSIAQHRYSKCEIKKNEIFWSCYFRQAKVSLCTRFKKSEWSEKCKTMNMTFCGGNQYIQNFFLEMQCIYMLGTYVKKRMLSIMALQNF